MAKRKISTEPEYTFISIVLESYRACVDAAINYEIKDKRLRTSETRVFRFESSIDVDGVANYPDDRVGAHYKISIHYGGRHEGELASKLSDYHIRDEDGLPKYRRERGVSVPVYDLPKSIGMFDRNRGANEWSGAVWVSPHTITDMLSLLPNVRPLYLDVREVKIGRVRWITGLTLQTTNPAEE